MVSYFIWKQAAKTNCFYCSLRFALYSNFRTNDRSVSISKLVNFLFYCSNSIMLSSCDIASVFSRFKSMSFSNNLSNSVRTLLTPSSLIRKDLYLVKAISHVFPFKMSASALPCFVLSISVNIQLPISIANSLCHHMWVDICNALPLLL